MANYSIPLMLHAIITTKSLL